jgi:hypothetical protein
MKNDDAIIIVHIAAKSPDIPKHYLATTLSGLTLIMTTLFQPKLQQLDGQRFVVENPGQPDPPGQPTEATNP